MELIIYITITLLVASCYAAINMFWKMERLEKIVDQQNQATVRDVVHDDIAHASSCKKNTNEVCFRDDIRLIPYGLV